MKPHIVNLDNTKKKVRFKFIEQNTDNIAFKKDRHFLSNREIYIE